MGGPSLKLTENQKKGTDRKFGTLRSYDHERDEAESPDGCARKLKPRGLFILHRGFVDDGM